MRGMEPQIEPNSAERRRTSRQKSLLRGTLHFNNKRTVMDCLVRDISPYGARLVFSGTVVTPDTLDLHIPQKEKTQRVHVIWRHGRELGVAFAQILNAEQPAERRADLAGRVARLEAELAVLKKLLRKVSAGPDADVA